MAIKNKLDKDMKENYYGFNFEETYFKIENIRIDIERNQVNIEVRGYASPEARQLEKDYDNIEKEIKDLKVERKELFNKNKEKENKTEKTNTTYEKKISGIDDKIEKLEKNREESSRVIGIYKEIFKCSLNDMNIKSFDKDGLKTAAYNYLKNNLDLFKGEDV